MTLVSAPFSESQQQQEIAAYINPAQELGAFAYEVAKYDYSVENVVAREVDGKYRWYAITEDGKEKRITKDAGVVLRAYFAGAEGTSVEDVLQQEEVAAKISVTDEQLDALSRAERIDFTEKRTPKQKRRREFIALDIDAEKSLRLPVKLGSLALANARGKANQATEAFSAPAFIVEDSFVPTEPSLLPGTRVDASETDGFPTSMFASSLYLPHMIRAAQERAALDRQDEVTDASGDDEILAALDFPAPVIEPDEHTATSNVEVHEAEGAYEAPMFVGAHEAVDADSSALADTPALEGGIIDFPLDDEDGAGREQLGFGGYETPEAIDDLETLARKIGVLDVEHEDGFVDPEEAQLFTEIIPADRLKRLQHFASMSVSELGAQVFTHYGAQKLIANLSHDLGVESMPQSVEDRVDQITKVSEKLRYITPWYHYGNAPITDYIKHIHQADSVLAVRRLYAEHQKLATQLRTHIIELYEDSFSQARAAFPPQPSKIGRIVRGFAANFEDTQTEE